MRGRCFLPVHQMQLHELHSDVSFKVVVYKIIRCRSVLNALGPINWAHLVKSKYLFKNV
jgi:hypothetical protein